MDKFTPCNVPRQPSGLALTTLTAFAAIAMAATLMLAGCATPGDVHTRATAIAPASVGVTGPSAAALPEAWWQTFQDPQLDALVTRAVKDSPSLTLAAARVQKAQAGVSATGAADQPQVRGTYHATRERFTEHGLFPPPLGGAWVTDNTLQAELSWELDFFGRNRAALESALGTQRAAEAEAHAARELLAANVARAYFQLGRAQAQRDVAQRTLSQRSETLGLISQRVQAGLDTNVELAQGQAALPETRQLIEALDEQIALARHMLAALTVQPPDALDALVVPLHQVRAVPLPSAVPADLLGRRADIVAARERVEAAAQGMKEARAEFYPSVDLLGFAGFSSFGLDKLLETGSRQFGIGPAIHLPIFDAGRLRANYSSRAADVDAAVASYNSAVLDAVHEVADSVSSLQSIERQQREQVQAQEAAERAYDLATQRYKAGLGTYLTVLTAETNVLTQRRSAAELKARALDAQVLLMRSLGGGYAAAAPGTPSAAGF